MTCPSRDSFIVEFYGLAGVGKTVMARAVTGLLRDHGVTTCSMSGFPIAPLQKFRVAALRTAVGIMRDIKPELGRKAAKTALGLYKDLVKLAEARRRGGLWISDQGICQRVATLHKCGATDWSSTWVERTNGICFHPDLVVIVSASREQVHLRRGIRDGSSDVLEVYDQAMLRRNRMIEDLEAARRLDPQREYIEVENETSEGVLAGAERIVECIFGCVSRAGLEKGVSEIARK